MIRVAAVGDVHLGADARGHLRPALESLHGHAHAGTEKGVTAGGTRVRNVAQPVLRRAYAVYDL